MGGGGVNNRNDSGVTSAMGADKNLALRRTVACFKLHVTFAQTLTN